MQLANIKVLMWKHPNAFVEGGVIMQITVKTGLGINSLFLSAIWPQGWTISIIFKEGNVTKKNKEHANNAKCF